VRGELSRNPDLDLDPDLDPDPDLLVGASP
jgi:hypothetical protein